MSATFPTYSLNSTQLISNEMLLGMRTLTWQVFIFFVAFVIHVINGMTTVWEISSFSAGTEAFVSDGKPVVNYERTSPPGSTYRITVLTVGFIDIVTSGSELFVNDIKYSFSGVAKLNFVVTASGSVYVNGDDYKTQVVPFPSVNSSFCEVITNLIEQKLIPYPGLDMSEIPAKASVLFPFSPNFYELAVAIYDWTTADFFRVDIMNDFVYTANASLPQDTDTIAQMIWDSTWGTYIPSDPDFMGALLMTPANSLDNVKLQLKVVNQQLRSYVTAISSVLASAVQALPRVSVQAKPSLFSGQVDVSQYTLARFSPQFLEFPGNAGPVGTPLYQPIEQAFQSGIFQVGNTITTKSFFSFTDSDQDAGHYSNGILLLLDPPSGSITWPSGAYITPLSDEADKTEYLFPPLTKFLITQIAFNQTNPKNGGPPLTFMYLTLTI